MPQSDAALTGWRDSQKWEGAMLSEYLCEDSQMARCKKCDEELHFDLDDSKDQIEVICAECGARNVIRWVASSPAIPGAQFEVQLVDGGGGYDHGNG
jgi:hypothetical protein